LRRDLETLDHVLPVDVPDDLPPGIMDLRSWLRWTASRIAARARESLAVETLRLATVCLER
jgi:hypothetical protein